MTERALTREAVLSGLQDIRLPVDAPGGLPAEILAAAGLGLLAAALAGLLLRGIMVGKRPTPAPSLADDIAAVRRLPDDRKQLELLRILKRARPERFARLAGDLYRPGGMPSSRILEAELSADD